MRKIRKLHNRWYDSRVPMRERIYELIVSMGVLACFVAAIVGFFIGNSLLMATPFFIGGLVFMALLLAGMRFHKILTLSHLSACLINFLIFPAAFFMTGGVNGGTPQWYIMGLIFVMLLLRDKARIIFFVLTVIGFGATYVIALEYPQLVIPLESTRAVYVDSSWSVLIVGVIIGVILIFQNDIYEKENKKVLKQKEEIEQLNLAQNRFFSNMSHEIRTPINTIIGLNEMILREDVSDETAENAMNIQSASKMLLTLINDILDLSKIESGEMRIIPVQYETSMMFSELVNMIWVRANDKGLKFRVKVSEDLPSMLYGDEVRIKQILVNLLTNAVKYTEKGTVTLDVRSEKIDTNRVRIHYFVTDTGIGIKKESMPFLFDSFRRVDEAKNRMIEGTGLGLSISRQLVDLMHGQISVDSIYTKGSTFHLVLEQEIVDPEPVGVMDFMVRRRARIRSQYRQSFEASKGRVLVVDDNDMNRLVAKKLLRDTALQVDTAESGMQCLQMTKNRFYHVILMDHMMPGMDGVETLQKIRSQENGMCRETPVVALTANAGSESREYYQKMGFQGYLAKPINGALLEASIVRYLPENLLEYVEESTMTEINESGTGFTAKKPIVITTDCLCDVPEDVLREHEIEVIPFYIRTSEGRFSDGIEIDSNNLFDYMEKDASSVVTECSSVSEYEKFFADRLSEAEEVIHLAASSSSSKSYSRAVDAATVFGNVHVIDSGHLSCGLGLMALYAADMVKRGCTVEEILAEMEELSDIVVTSVLLRSTDQLYQNERIGRPFDMFCHLFHLRPSFHMEKKHLKLCGFQRGGFEHACRTFVHKEFRDRKKIDPRVLMIIYAGCKSEQLETLQKYISQEMQFDHIAVQKSSATVATNTGLGSIGLVYMKNRSGEDGRI